MVFVRPAGETEAQNSFTCTTPGKSDLNIVSQKQIAGKNNSAEIDVAVDMGRSWKFRASVSGFLLVYTLCGAWIFQLLERDSELETLRVRRSILSSGRLKLIEAMGNLSNNSSNLIQFRNNSEEWIVALSAIEDYESAINSILNGELRVYLNETELPRSSWGSFQHALFFVFILITTIGYGSLTPTTMWGRIFCVNYALIGIPVMLIFIAQTGKILGRLCTTLSVRICGGWTSWIYFTSQTDASYVRKMIGTFASLSVVVILLLCYMGLGALLFHIKESWGFVNSFYFCFITLTTVGFGDLIPRPPEPGKDNPFLGLARAFYILCGLAITATAIQLVQKHYTEIWIKTEQAKRKVRENKCKLKDKIMAASSHRSDPILTPAGGS